MNWTMVMDLLMELVFNAANSLSGYMLGAKVLGMPEPAAWLLAACVGVMGMANHWRALRKNAVVLLALALGVSGCSATSQLTQTFTTDLVAAKGNFDAAKMTTESACVQSLIDLVGQQAATSFDVKGLVSLGSVAYIEYAKSQGGGGLVPISESCYAVIGKITVAAGKQGAAAFSGGLVR